MGALLVVVFLFIPVIEIYVIIQVGQLIGPLPTLALLIFESLLGAWLLKHQGRVAWVALQEAVASGRLPARELVDAGLVLVGGTLLLAPGFITDVVGFFFILPPTRPLARRLLLWLLVRRAGRVAARAEWTVRATTQRRPPGGSTGRPGPTRVVRGEIVTGSDGVSARPDPEDASPDDKGPGRVAGG